MSPDYVQIAPIQHGTLERNNVWRLTVDGQRYLLKRHLITRPIGESAFTPFQIESSVLSILQDAGCSVPKIVWKSDPDLCILLEWCGESTFDDLAQAEPVESLNTVTINAVREFCRIEKGFIDHADAIEPYIYPLDYTAFLRQTMQRMLDQGRKTMSYLAHLGGGPVSPDQESTLNKLWTHISECLHNDSLTLGTLDYNARNIMVNGQKATFVDFGTVGWDWSERRLVQSFNSLGANRAEGNFVNLLDREVVAEYASQLVTYRAGCSEAEIAAQVDYHNILFYLSIIHRLLEAVARPEWAENRALLNAWADAEARLQRVLDVLQHSQLSDDPYARRIRELVRQSRLAH